MGGVWWVVAGAIPLQLRGKSIEIIIVKLTEYSIAKSIGRVSLQEAWILIFHLTPNNLVLSPLPQRPAR